MRRLPTGDNRAASHCPSSDIPLCVEPTDSPWLRLSALFLAGIALLLAGCAATRPVNPPITKADNAYGYRSEGRAVRGAANDTLVVLAFSGGGTRAAAFSFGVLEELRRTEITINGRKTRLLDEVDIITGVSGGNNPLLARAVDVPDIDLFAIDVSFAANPDPTERDYLNDTPTSFVLSDEQVDRLHSAAGAAIRSSSDFQRLLRDLTAAPSSPRHQATRAPQGPRHSCVRCSRYFLVAAVTAASSLSACLLVALIRTRISGGSTFFPK